MDLAVPFLPRISTPPILGLTALNNRARFMAVCPTMAVNGKLGSGRCSETESVTGQSLYPLTDFPGTKVLLRPPLVPHQREGDPDAQQCPKEELAHHGQCPEQLQEVDRNLC